MMRFNKIEKYVYIDYIILYIGICVFCYFGFATIIFVKILILCVAEDVVVSGDESSDEVGVGCMHRGDEGTENEQPHPHMYDIIYIIYII